MMMNRRHRIYLIFYLPLLFAHRSAELIVQVLSAVSAASSAEAAAEKFAAAGIKLLDLINAPPKQVRDVIFG